MFSHSSRASHTDRRTNRQTDGKAISIAERSTFAKTLLRLDNYAKFIVNQDACFRLLLFSDVVVRLSILGGPSSCQG